MWLERRRLPTCHSASNLAHQPRSYHSCLNYCIVKRGCRRNRHCLIAVQQALWNRETSTKDVALRVANVPVAWCLPNPGFTQVCKPSWPRRYHSAWPGLSDADSTPESLISRSSVEGPSTRDDVRDLPSPATTSTTLVIAISHTISPITDLFLTAAGLTC